MWNDTNVPLAYLITFRCYGTWLHGDERGSVDRFHNKYNSPDIAPDKRWHQHNARTLKHEPVSLSAAQRKCVETAVQETCNLRGWLLRASSVRTNHVHVVVSIANAMIKTVSIAFKANATRKMRQENCWQHENSPWADKGSCRYLWNERHVGLAVDYVIDGQGDKLPEFD